MSKENQSVTAAVLVIGDELLSGRTKDTNVGHIAETMTSVGVDLREVRFVPDVEDEIVAALNALRSRYTYVFTTGGIGPTHDDITADAVAKAFGVNIGHDPRAVALLKERFTDGELNEARMRMARIPAGAELVVNPVSKAPGFWIGNVIVMAGVPSIMRAMLDHVVPQLKTGAKVLSETIDAGLKEGDIAGDLREIAKSHPDTTIGSYPYMSDKGFATRVVVRSRDAMKLAAAKADVDAMSQKILTELAAKRNAS
ncbi:MAG: competence/damage-inducible protein A [Xanthobacteraceae bacterium]|nr:competence/damage-inducible protein A [Xanthobacteraceae bacterium]